VRVLVVTTVCAGLIAFISDLAIVATYGAEFAPAVAVIWGLLPGTVLFAVARTVQSYLTAMDRPFATMGASVAAMATGVTLLVTLPPHLGPASIGLAVSAGYALYSVVVLATFVRTRPVVTGSSRGDQRVEPDQRESAGLAGDVDRDRRRLVP
jgi:O-antigen/teichoic acid export membrane protein